MPYYTNNFQFKHTCPEIDDKLEGLKDSIFDHLEEFKSETQQGKNPDTNDYTYGLYELIEETYEAVRSTNENMRTHAENQITDLINEAIELKEEIKELKDKIWELENEINK